jgi:type I restriction enzyme, S subunit
MKSPLNAHWKVPQDWKIVAIQDVTSDWRGGAPFEPDDFTAEGFPVLHKGGIQRRGKITIDARKKTFTTEEYAKSHQKSVIDRSYMAATLRDLVPSGPSIGLMADLSLSPSDKYILAQGAYGFKLDADVVDSAYLVLLSNYEPFREYIKRYCVGSTQIHIRTPVFQELKIPLPPIETQKRIAAILDQAEALRSLRRQSIGQLDALGRSVFLEMFGDPVTNPNKLSIIKLGELTRITSGSTPSRTISENFIGSIPWVKTTEVCGNLILETEEKISELALKNSSCHIYPTGSIIVALYGQGKTRGRAAILGIDAATNQACGVLLPHVKYNTQFLFWQLQLSYDRLRELGRGGNQPNLNLGLLGDFYVLLPPLALQQEFADRIGAIEALKAQHCESLAKMDTLFASLQHRAFRGEL